MKVRDEIELYADEKDKPVLRWLFERNHWDSQWNYVAVCSFASRRRVRHRVWQPSPNGRMLYEHHQMLELLEQAPCTCTEVDGFGTVSHEKDDPTCFANKAAKFLSPKIIDAG